MQIRKVLVYVCVCVLKWQVIFKLVFTIYWSLTPRMRKLKLLFFSFLFTYHFSCH